ncbi:hypothetical protein BRC81_10125 [Halobacteriales archaeon QS_1_68_20]|nr:MAG: hypothetical protein BRC81_10125 [Halobacteriales archaeon QS_1_68_20]
MNETHEDDERQERNDGRERREDEREADRPDGEDPGDAGPDAAELPEDVPVWEDEYLDRVSDRLFTNFDLEKDRSVRGERFDMYGRMEMHTQKHFFHPALSYAHHEAVEHLFAARRNSVTVADLERYVEFAHDLADEWIDANEEHYGTDFTFAFVVPEISTDVQEFVDGFEDRTMLKYGYYGRYEVNLVVAAPEDETVVRSESADVGRAFTLWESADEEERKGLLRRLLP